MERPAWVTVTGILGILFAVVGLLGAAQMVFFPRFLEAQRQVADELENSASSDSGVKKDTPSKSSAAVATARSMKKILNVPAWFKPLSSMSGVVELAVSGFYLFASIQFLSLTRRGLDLFRWALGVSMAFHILKGVAAVASLSILGLALVGGSLFWIVVNGVLFLTVAFGDHKVFREKADQ